MLPHGTNARAMVYATSRYECKDNGLCYLTVRMQGQWFMLPHGTNARTMVYATSRYECKDNGLCYLTVRMQGQWYECKGNGLCYLTVRMQGQWFMLPHGTNARTMVYATSRYECKDNGLCYLTVRMQECSVFSLQPLSSNSNCIQLFVCEHTQALHVH